MDRHRPDGCPCCMLKDSAVSSEEVSQADVLDRVNSLRRKLSGLATLDTLVDEHRVSTGCEAFDNLLPSGALQPGMLVELLAERRGSGAGAIAIECARQMLGETNGCLVVTDRWRRFYPPAAVARGIETKDLSIVRSSDQQIMSGAEELWALDQALRCAGVGVVMAWLDKVDPLAFRRLQLAAETGQTLALLMRPARVRALPTWSDVQLMVRPLPSSSTNPSRASRDETSKGSLRNENRYCQVTLLRQRGRAGSNTQEGASIDLEISETGKLTHYQHVSSETVRHATHTLHMAPRVAHPASRRRQSGA